MPTALIVAVDDALRERAADVSRQLGFDVVTATTLAGARARLSDQAQAFAEIVLATEVLPDGTGVSLVTQLPRGAESELVILYAPGKGAQGVELLRAGATDVSPLPFDEAHWAAILRRLPTVAELKSEIFGLREDLRRIGHFGPLVGACAPMQAVYDAIERAAPSAASVLLVGDGGCGKELVARALHQRSRRRRGPWLAFNCSTLSPHLIEAELFGHAPSGLMENDPRAQGWLERARGGTLFLDEITGLPAALQARLVKCLDQGSLMRSGNGAVVRTDVRIVAATHRDPMQAVAEGRLREDLLQRLGVFTIHLPPLRDRGADVELLAQHFLNEMNRTQNERKHFAASAFARLYERPWAGNVRELRNLVHRSFILCDDVVDLDGRPSPPPVAVDPNLILVRVGTPLEEVERRLTMATLLASGNIKRRAARILGISLKTLYNRLDAYRARDAMRARVGLAPVIPLIPLIPAIQQADEVPSRKSVAEADLPMSGQPLR